MKRRLDAFLIVVGVLGWGCALDLKGNLYGLDAQGDPDGVDWADMDVDVPQEDVESEEGYECLRDSDCSDDDPCNGIEICDPLSHACLPGSPREDGTICGDSPRQICLGGSCTASVCGDGFVDRGAGEFCDDGNEDPSDGCHECQITCSSDGDCDDEDDCNGAETCDLMAGLCRNGTALPDGTQCGTDPRSICLGGDCMESICGDGYVDVVLGESCDGDASLSCDTTCGTTGTQYCSSCTWSACMPPDEVCNGADDDCDGSADETFPCVQGQAGVACTSICGTTGTGTCTAACQAPDPSACTPPAEVCNGADDDCDGSPDETFPCVQGQAGVACTTTCDTAGTGTCTAACQVPAPSACTPPVETCNGVDDDCNGTCDDGWACCAGTGGSCTTGCSSTGSRTCSASCAWSACTPPAETCNGVDDDCDGGVDEDFACSPGQTQSCTTSCNTTGTRTCTTSCAWSDCVPPAETCNGVDDDCDGQCDDGFGCCAGSPGTCTTGCGSTGSRTCSASCAWSVCTPPVETCNGVDDDCDGQCDDGFGCCAGMVENDCTTCGGLGTPRGTRTCSESCAWSPCCSEHEFCNGCDDDCNGTSDEPGATGYGLRVTYDSSGSYHPTMAYNPVASQYGITWTDGRPGNFEVYFTRISSAGTKVGGDIRETNNSAESSRPWIVFSGAGYGVVWMDAMDGDFDIYLATLDADGTNFSYSRITNTTSNAYYPEVVHTGAGFGVAWEDRRDGNWEIYFAGTDEGRNITTGPLRVTSNGSGSYYPTLAFDGTDFTLAWRDDRDGNGEIYTDTVPFSGAPSNVRFTSALGTSSFPSLAQSSPTECGAAWFDYRSGTWEVYFARVNSGSGAKIGSDVLVGEGNVVESNKDVVSIEWNGAQYGLAWTDDRTGDNEIYFTRLNTSGVQLSPVERITNAAGRSAYPSLVWDGTRWALAWYDGRDGNYEIYFMQLGCITP